MASRMLRLNQGDPSEARVYFLPHFVARSLGLFEKHGVDIQFVWAKPGDHLAKSGQIPAVLAGEADLTVGGPMVTMRMQAEGTARLMNFIEVVRVNPWFLAARAPEPGFSLAALKGRTVFDVGLITTASIVFRWLLRENGLEGEVEIVEGSGDEAADLAAFVAGRHDVLLHSLHPLGPFLAEGRIAILSDLAQPTGPVPWSAYIALPETIVARRADFAAFTAAIGEALAWVDGATPEAIADLVGKDYPGYPPAGLVTAIALYKQIGVWPRATPVPREDFEHFQDILMEMGWFQKRVAFEDQVVSLGAAG